MIVFPAIDLKDKKCVRLYQGDMNSSHVVAEDVLKTAQKFQSQGAKYIHMVDLDGAIKGEPGNIENVLEVVKNVDIPLQFGGGVRDMETLDYLIKQGINRVVLGTTALKDVNMVKEAIKKYGKKIAIGIDAKNENVAVDGWKNVSSINYIEMARNMEELGVKTIIFTDISRDGTLKGPNLQQLKKLKNNTKCNIIASGGVKNIQDVKKLKELDLYGVIIGKAIYSGDISLKQAIEIGGK